MTDLGDWTITETYKGIWQIHHNCEWRGTVHMGRYDSSILRCDYCKEDLPQEVHDAGLLTPYLNFPVSGVVDD